MGKRELHELKPIDYNMLKWYFSFRTPGTCESVILDSYLWKDYYNSKYYYNNKGLLWVFSNKDGYFTVIPLCKDEDLKMCFEDLRDYFNNELGIKLKMYLVDEEAVEILNLSDDEFDVVEERDYFDYVYDAGKLKTLSGKAYHKKKNHVNAFLKAYDGRYEFKMLDCSNRPEVLDFLETWKEERAIVDEYNRVDYESAGIKYILDNCSMIPYQMGGVYIDGKLEAFSIGSYSKPEETAYIHVEKANPTIRGLYNFINQQFLTHGFPNATLVNREDDMGLEGLRKAKLSYKPLHLVKKFNIIER